MRKREGVLLQFFKNVSPGMVLLLMGETEVAHIFAEDLDAVGVFAARRSPAHFLYSRYDAQRHLDDVRHVFVDGAEVEFVVGDGENAARWSVIGTEVGDVACLPRNTFAAEEGRLVWAVGECGF